MAWSSVVSGLIELLFRFLEKHDESQARAVRARIIADAGTEWMRVFGGQDLREGDDSGNP